jgi:hypothetical protein
MTIRKKLVRRLSAILLVITLAMVYVAAKTFNKDTVTAGYSYDLFYNYTYMDEVPVTSQYAFDHIDDPDVIRHPWGYFMGKEAIESYQVADNWFFTERRPVSGWKICEKIQDTEYEFYTVEETRVSLVEYSSFLGSIVLDGYTPVYTQAVTCP